jgi:hypothetical protein
LLFKESPPRRRTHAHATSGRLEPDEKNDYSRRAIHLPDTEVTATQLERREIPSFSESREARIAEAAYWRAERRGFSGGQELDDWLAAEKEVDQDIAARQARRDRE